MQFDASSLAFRSAQTAMALPKATMTLLGLCASYALATQMPLHQLPNAFTSPSINETWDLNTPPNPNATHNLVFSTVSSLLQHWPNTRYRNGHTIVPGSVAPGTLLYHGRKDNNIPSSPDWTSTDPEHSHNFCRGTVQEGCWHLTLVARRELNVLYFDGSSAAKMPNGSMDSQDIVAWGEVKPDKSFSERERINDMCEWGRGLSIDGFVRMEMDFEIMLCDFSPAGGVDVSSFLHLATRPSNGRRPRRSGEPKPPDRDGPGNESSREDFLESLPQSHHRRLHSSPHYAEHLSTSLGEPPPGPPGHGPPPSLPSKPEDGREDIYAGQWHARYPGDTRVTLDLTRLISFYDTALAPSLVEVRYGKERWGHRIMGISNKDVKAVVRKLKEVTLPNAGHAKQRGSGVDWQTLIHVIVDRYADRLEIVEHLLNKTASSNNQEVESRTNANTSRTLGAVCAQLEHMLTPYILHGVAPTYASRRGNGTMAWAEPIYKLCAGAHTSYLFSVPLYSSMSDSELLILDSVQHVEKEICRVVSRMWAEGVELGLSSSAPVAPSSYTSPSTPAIPTKDLQEAQIDMDAVANRWRKEISLLMTWLDWSVWVKCRPSCGFKEICYLPTWPFFRREHRKPENSPADADTGSSGDEYEEWERPQPRCIKRFSTGFYE